MNPAQICLFLGKQIDLTLVVQMLQMNALYGSLLHFFIIYFSKALNENLSAL